MLVSNFFIGGNSWYGGPGSIARYLLQITNLESKEIGFGIECWIAPPYQKNEKQISWSLQKQFHQLDDDRFYSYELVSIPANDARTWELTPSLGYAPDLLGYVTIRVPVLREHQVPYGIGPQSESPVRMLLSAWREDRWYNGGKEVGCTQSSVQLATGKASNEIPPDTSLFTQPFLVSRYIRDRVSTTKATRGAMGMREEDAPQALIDLLAQLAAEPGEIDALNEALQELKAPVSVRLNP